MSQIALGEVAQVIMGQAPPGETCNHEGIGTPFVKAGEFDDRRPLIREWTTKPIQLAQSSDVLVCVVGATAGKVNVGVDCAIGRSVGAVRPAPGRLDQTFAYHFLRTKTPSLRAGSQGSAQGVITRRMLETLLLPDIPLPEQRRIADILDKADAIRRKRKEAIALTEELLRSTFQEMFGDPVTNPKGWPTETIEELCSRGASLVDGPFGSSLKPEHYVDSGVKVVRNWNIYDDRFDFSAFKYITESKFREVRRSEVAQGDVLITTKGTVGDVCLAPDLGGPAVLSASGTVRLRVPPDNTYLPEFVVAQMTTTRYKRYLHSFEAGSAQQYLNLSAIKKMRLIRPPIDRQNDFSLVRARTREAGADVEEAHVEIDRLSRSLVEQSFAVGSK